jgi:HSP20 family protein
MRSLTPSRQRRDLEPFSRGVEDMFERFVERFFSPWEGDRSMEGNGSFGLAVESQVKNGNLIIRADLPGVDPKDISLSVHGNHLTIEGERKQEKKEEGEKDFFYQEVAYGKFSRMVSLPASVNTEQITARYTNGVLEVSLPAPQEMTGKKIQIEAQ